ncbi:hypothetical protein BGX20_003071 [Mortierella sp. AD010]|nr:hypothetical protein BGX20_003071 [Mortierella sp. AD010]
MSSTRPARSSARQSALRQQELEAELEAERQRISARNGRSNNGNNGMDNDIDNDIDNDGGLHSSSSSSRSLSPALSESASLSSEGHSGSSDNNRTAVFATKQDDDDSDPSKPFSDSNLTSYWEIALVYGFLIKFKSLLRQNCPLHEFSIEDIEAGLLAKSTNVCIEEIHANLLSNMLNRKKAVDSNAWQKVLLETLDSKYRTGEMEYDQNPLRYYGNYYLIPPIDRVHILKALVHWVLQEGTAIRQGIEDNNEYYAIEPFGTDQAKRTYWIFRETKNPKKKSTGWETVAKSLDEIRTLAESFIGSTSKQEKALHGRLLEEIIQPIEEKAIQNKLKQERLEKRMIKLAELHQLAATRTTRTRSSNRLNQPKYTFDDDDDEFEDEYDLYRRPPSRRRHGADQNTTIPVDPVPTEPGGANHQSQQEELDQRERSPSAEDAASSARSSVGRDSDSSIRVALQRTRVGDEEGSTMAGNSGENLNCEDSVENSYRSAEESSKHDIDFESMPTLPPSRPIIIPESVPAEPQVHTSVLAVDVEMKSSEI